MAFDPLRARVVLYGGCGGTPQGLHDTWEWDGSAWLEVATNSLESGPGGRCLHQMAYDARVGRVVLMGGRDQNNEIWEWNGASWTPRGLGGPAGSARPGNTVEETAMRLAADPAGHRLLLLRTEGRTDLWALDGAGWAYMGARPSGDFSWPIERRAAAVAYDAHRGELVVFGGLREGTFSTNLRDTWTWDGVDWREFQATGSPSPGGGALYVAAYHDGLESVVTHGISETWRWEGSSWTLEVPASSSTPPTRRLSAMVYDSSRGQLVLFGGMDQSDQTLGDTWTW